MEASGGVAVAADQSPFVSDDEVENEDAEGEVEIINLEPDETDVDLTHSKLRNLELLEPLAQLEVVGARRNIITTIGDSLLPSAGTLRELDLYDNSLEAFEPSVEALTNLEILDVSYNRIRVIENVSLPKLARLYLVCNKVSKIAGLDNVPNLKVLELGSNRLRALDGLASVPMLDQLYIGRNKIARLQNLSTLTNLTILSMQSNRVTKIEGLECLVNLECLYFSHNGIEKVEGLEKNLKLTTLDLANNRIAVIENVSHLTELDEFWFNHNRIEAWSDVEKLVPLKKLQTVYLEGNPLAKDPAYRRKLKLTLPHLTQIDATMC